MQTCIYNTIATFRTWLSLHSAFYSLSMHSSTQCCNITLELPFSVRKLLFFLSAWRCAFNDALKKTTKIVRAVSAAR